MNFLDLHAFSPVSFQYDGRSSANFLPGWPAQRSTEPMSGGRVIHTTYSDPSAGLKVVIHMRYFDDFPAVDWVVEFENSGTHDTPLIKDILPFDISLPFSTGERLRLHHANGSSCQKDDFIPQLTELGPHTEKWLAPVGGRSSNGTLPFMNLQRNGCGLVLAVGWSGQWMACFQRSVDSFHMSGGMQRTSLRLHPGEKIRTPRMLMLLWEGVDESIGSNQFRRLLMEHYLPRLNGELVLPPVAQCLQFNFYLTGKAGEALEMKALPRVAEIGAEVYWVDACWYGGQAEWWQEVGSWTVNRLRFPNGLKPISDAAHQHGMKFLLWFEPERVRPNSLLHQEHPEFLLSSDKDPDNFLLNLGLPEAQRYITDLISQRITENGVDIYRQDFNFDPLPYWQAADEVDRIGMTEIRYVEGHYAMWDELRKRHPGLWIDNCSSGGRRIDLETLSRAVPLWPSDFSDTIGLRAGMGLHVGNQCVNVGLARWVPLFGGGLWNFTPYSLRSQVIGGFTFGCHIENKDFPQDETDLVVNPNDVMVRGKTLLGEDFPVDLAAQAIAEWKSIRPFFLGDFYPLLPLTVSDHDWCAWQFHREDLGGGVAVFLRRHRSPFASMEAVLRCVDLDAVYEVSLSSGFKESPSSRMSGKDFYHLVIDIPVVPGSLLLRYRRVKEPDS